MAKSFLVRLAFLVLVFPAAVCAAPLDDYYLAKFPAGTRAARSLSGVAAEGAVHAERCRTPLYRSLKRDWTALEPATQRTLAKYVARPLLLDKAIHPSPGGHFNIHFARSGADAPDLTDADADLVPDWVETVAAVFETVYQEEVTRMGYRPPPGARYDVYLRNLVGEGVFGLTSDDGAPAFPATSVGSYIEIDRAFSDPIYTANGSYQPQQLLQVTAAHEFHHAIQFGYNYYFDLWYGEVSATWIEDEIYDAVDQLYSYLPNYLTKTHILPINAPLGGNSEYGRWIFNRYLSERHSSLLVRDIWAKLGTMAAPADGSDIPMLPVIDSVVRGAGSSIAEDLLGFAKRLYRADWGSHPLDIPQIDVVAPLATYSDYPVSMSAINSRIGTLPSYSFAYYKFLPSASAPEELTLTFASVPAGMEIVAIKKGKNGSFEEYPLDRSTGTITVPSFNAAATAELQLIVCNSKSTAPPVSAPPSSGGGGGGGGCFIATAAYGSYLHPKVAELRAFRDRHLLTNAPGRLFVTVYYWLSPPLADLIAEHEWMRRATRGALVPVIFAVEHRAGTLVLLLLSGGGVVWRLLRRRSSQVKGEPERKLVRQ